MPCSPRVISAASHCARCAEDRVRRPESPRRVRMQPMRGGFGLVMVGRDERRAGVAIEVRNLGVDDQRDPAARRRGAPDHG